MPTPTSFSPPSICATRALLMKPSPPPAPRTIPPLRSSFLKATLPACHSEGEAQRSLSTALPRRHFGAKREEVLLPPACHSEASLSEPKNPRSLFFQSTKFCNVSFILHTSHFILIFWLWYPS